MAHFMETGDGENTEMLSEVREMVESGFSCDFIIKVGDSSFPVHRQVLAAASKYFRLMLSTDKKESQDGYAEMKDISPDIMRRCIAFMYHSENVVCLSKIEEILPAAKLMELNDLAEKCFKCLETCLSADNCIMALNLCNLYGNRNRSEIEKFIVKNFNAVVHSDMFPRVELKDLMEFIEFFSAGQSTEKIKWESITKWVKFDPNREEFFPGLFKLMELDLMEPGFFQENVRTEPLVNSVECMNILKENFVPRANTQRNLLNGTSESPKTAHIACLNLENNKIDSFNINSKRWGNISSIPVKWRWYFKLGSLDGVLYVMTDDDLCFFDSKNKKWSSTQSGTSTGEHFAVVEFQDNLYVLVKHHTKCYGISKSVPGCRLRFFCAAPSDNYIYAVGGAIGTYCQWDQARKYDPHRNRWAKIASMRYERREPAAACLGDKLYVMGGMWNKRPLNSVEYYNPASNAWTDVVSMCVSRHKLTACVFDGKIYAVGGAKDENDDDLSNNSIESYDAKANKWIIVSEGRINPGHVQSCIYLK